MGFYSPSQLIQDAQRHQVTILPIDVCYSHWNHQLTGINSQTLANHRPAIRLGLRLIKGFKQTAAERIVHAQQQLTTFTLKQLTQFAQLSKSDLEALARSDALRSLEGHRHQAHWSVLGMETESNMTPSSATFSNSTSSGVTSSPSLSASPDQIQATLPRPNMISEVIADYQYTGLSLRTHPMGLIRCEYKRFQPYKRACDLALLNHGRFIRIAGLVTGRQRPSTASGTIFLTLEDETGNSNIIVWPRLSDRYRAAVYHGKLLLIKGTIEKSLDYPPPSQSQSSNTNNSQTVTHIIAGHIEDHTALLSSMNLSSRDFH